MRIKQVLITLISVLVLAAQAQAQTPIAKEGPDFKFYGILMPQLIVATHAMGSFGNTNMTAMTEAAQSPHPERGRASFQTQQSRMGFDYRANPETRAKVEVDFIDFAKSTPTVQALPRLRILKIEHDLSPETTLFMGQDWDVFSPQKAYTYNLVGNHFRNGNASFIRQQVGATSQVGALEFSGSVGFPIPDALNSDQAPELEQQPVYQARIGTKIGSSVVTLSGIFARYAYEPIAAGNGGAPPAQITALDGTSSGANISYEANFDRLEVRAESFFGHNLANLGTLTVGLGTRSLNDVDEVGGFLSLRYKFERSSLFGGFGIDHVLNHESITSATHGLKGMQSNQQARLGFDWEFTPKFKAYVESSYFVTKYFNSTESAYAQINGFQLAF